MMFSELSNNLFRFSVFCIQAVKLHPSSCSADLDCRDCRLASKCSSIELLCCDCWHLLNRCINICDANKVGPNYTCILRSQKTSNCENGKYFLILPGSFLGFFFFHLKPKVNNLSRFFLIIKN